MKTRLYKSGTSWCLWRWTLTDSEYITRLHLIKTPLFAICLHWINKPDPEPYLHDHPVSFLSLILTGGYHEQRKINGKLSIKERNWFNLVKADKNDQHSIISVKPNTVTLAFMGPKVREWGFHAGSVWIWWKDYYKELREQKTPYEVASQFTDDVKPLSPKKYKLSLRIDILEIEFDIETHKECILNLRKELREKNKELKNASKV